MIRGMSGCAMGSETWRFPGESHHAGDQFLRYIQVLLDEKVFVEMQMQAEAYRQDRQEAARSRVQAAKS